MAPAFERAAAELEPRFRFLKVDADQVPQISARYGISSIPTLMMFFRGQPVARSAGAMDTGRILAWVRAHDPTAQAPRS
jgi:thioredoxin 2